MRFSKSLFGQRARDRTKNRTFVAFKAHFCELLNRRHRRNKSDRELRREKERSVGEDELRPYSALLSKCDPLLEITMKLSLFLRAKQEENFFNFFRTATLSKQPINTEKHIFAFETLIDRGRLCERNCLVYQLIPSL